MNTKTNRIRSLFLAATLALSCVAVPIVLSSTGCASSQVAAGSEAFVVEAEKDIRTAFHVVDAFLLWEASSRSTAGPAVTAAADKLRTDFPGWHASAQAVLRTYKVTRSPGAKGDVQTWLATLTAAMVEAVRYLPPAESQKALTTK